MENYRKTAHRTYDIKYHMVWITKYRKPVITGKIAMGTRELLQSVCKKNDIEILSGHVPKDHIHLLVSVPPHLPASSGNVTDEVIVKYIKNQDINEKMKGNNFEIGEL